jgi:hypothetical protein
MEGFLEEGFQEEPLPARRAAGVIRNPCKGLEQPQMA